MNLRWPLLFHFRLKSFGFVRLCAMPSKAELNFHLLSLRRGGRQAGSEYPNYNHIIILIMFNY